MPVRPVLTAVRCRLLGILVMAEIATPPPVQMPWAGLISLRPIEKLHRLEDGMLAALILWIVIPAVAAAIVADLLPRGRRDGYSILPFQRFTKGGQMVIPFAHRSGS